MKKGSSTNLLMKIKCHVCGHVKEVDKERYERWRKSFRIICLGNAMNFICNNCDSRATLTMCKKEQESNFMEFDVFCETCKNMERKLIKLG